MGAVARPRPVLQTQFEFVLVDTPRSADRIVSLGVSEIFESATWCQNETSARSAFQNGPIALLHRQPRLTRQRSAVVFSGILVKRTGTVCALGATVRGALAFGRGLRRASRARFSGCRKGCATGGWQDAAQRNGVAQPSIPPDRGMLEEVKELVGSQTFDHWFQNKASIEIADNEVTIGVANPFLLSWMQHRFRPAVTEAARRILGESARFVSKRIRPRACAGPAKHVVIDRRLARRAKSRPSPHPHHNLDAQGPTQLNLAGPHAQPNPIASSPSGAAILAASVGR